MKRKKNQEKAQMSLNLRKSHIREKEQGNQQVRNLKIYLLSQLNTSLKAKSYFVPLVEKNAT